MFVFCENCSLFFSEFNLLFRMKKNKSLFSICTSIENIAHSECKKEMMENWSKNFNFNAI